MKTITLIILALAIAVKGYAENPRFQEVGTPIPANTNLNIVWEAGTSHWSNSAMVYRIVPNKFSKQVISNLEAICSFTIADRMKDDSNGMFYQNRISTRKLSVDYNSGKIAYDTIKKHYDEKHLTVDVPEKSLVPKLTADILGKLGVNPNEVNGYFGTNAISVSELGKTYYVGTNSITNTESRFGYFRRSLNGWAVVGSDGGRIYFGEHGELDGIELQWSVLEPFKSHPTLTQDDLIAEIRDGKARMGMVPQNVGDINWGQVKGVKILKAWPSYYAGTSPTTSQWMYPFMTLWTSVDTGNETVEVEIDVPIITD